MKPFTEVDKEKEIVKVDFRYFIQSAIQKNLPWHTLATFLTDLAPTLEKCKQIIKILVYELEKWVTKAENEAKSCTSVSQSHLEYTESDINNFTYHEDQKLSKSSEMADFEIPDETQNDIREIQEENVENDIEEKSDTTEITENLNDKSSDQYLVLIPTEKHSKLEGNDMILLEKVENHNHEFIESNDQIKNLEEQEQGESTYSSVQ